MSDSMSLDEGSEHAPISSTFLHPSCICTWERVADHWEMIRLVPHCVMHRHMLDPRYKDAHTGRTPDPDEPLSSLLSETLTLADEAVAATITDEHIEQRLREVKARHGEEHDEASRPDP